MSARAVPTETLMRFGAASVVDHDLGHGLLNIIERRQEHVVWVDALGLDVVLADEQYDAGEGLM